MNKQLWMMLNAIDIKRLTEDPHIKCDGPVVIKVNENGAFRVLNGRAGMTFLVDSFTRSGDCTTFIAHVRDYRFADNQRGFQIWSIAQEGYEVIAWI